MRVAPHIFAFILASVLCVAQSPVAEISPPATPAPSGSLHLPPAPLFDIKQSDYKFSVDSLMMTLRDSRHEGWILAAYPDPATKRPLIGAGFTLDLDDTPHPQLDPLNAHAFLEPSSAQLWQGAELDSARLQHILAQYQRTLARWPRNKRAQRRRLRSLPPDITDEDALALLRVSSLQAIYNARAYCRYFGQMTPAQQMGLTELVYQMGTNLEEFVSFLSVLNRDSDLFDVLNGTSVADNDRQQWQLAQQMLIQSQWAHRYRGRAITVIAKFDPDYAANPILAENRVAGLLPAPAVHHKAAHKHGGKRG